MTMDAREERRQFALTLAAELGVDIYALMAQRHGFHRRELAEEHADDLLPELQKMYVERKAGRLADARKAGGE